MSNHPPPASEGSLVLAPEVSIRLRQGKFVVQGGSGTFQTDQPGLLAWLLGFAQPREPQQVLGALRPDERQQAQNLLSHLQRIGVLRAAARENKQTGIDAEREHKESARQMGALAQVVYALACDLRGFGPFAHRNIGGDSSLGERLTSLLANVETIRTELADLKPDYVRHQLSQLGIAPGSSELKLHIGAGGNNLEGWINADVHPAPLALNLDWGLPLADGSARYVFLSHLLEHMFYPQQAMKLLTEIRRVLAPDGIVRIVVPDIEKCLRAYIENDREFFDSRRETWTWWPEGQTRLEDFLAYAGAGPNPGQLFEAHKFGYDYETLERALQRSGFAEIRRCGFMQSPHEALRVDSASLVAEARYGESHYSLFVEAVRPK